MKYIYVYYIYIVYIYICGRQIYNYKFLRLNYMIEIKIFFSSSTFHIYSENIYLVMQTVFNWDVFLS